MSVKYNRKLKIYESNIIEGAWPTRLDAEAAELPADLLDKAVELAGSLKVAIKAVRLVVDGKIRLDGSPNVYIVESSSHPDLPHTVDLAQGCTCEGFQHGVICSHWAAALLLASADDNEAEPAPPCKTCDQLIDELFGRPVQVRDSRGRIAFGDR